MKKLFLALALSTALTSPVFAQQAVKICVEQADGSCVTVKTATPLPTTGGGGTVTVGPYAYTPLTPGQHNLAVVTSTALTIPTGATYAILQATTANVKYTTDGTTTPTSSVGMTLGVGSSVALSGATVLTNFRAISATGTLDVEFFK